MTDAERTMTEEGYRAPASEPAWRGAAAKVLEGFDKGVFLRDNSGDADPAWAIKLLPYLTALAKLQEAVEQDATPLPQPPRLGQGEGQ